MHSYKETRTLPYNAELIHNIVMDVEKYPEFLPWCTGATIQSKDEKFLFAKLKLASRGAEQSYVSRVSSRFADGVYIIEAEAISGPFKHLKSVWKIKDENNSAEVNFSIDFELKSRILDMVVGMVFSSTTKKMISAFETRAKELSRK